MSYRFSGRPRSSSGRSFSSRSGGGRPGQSRFGASRFRGNRGAQRGASIHPSLYVNQAVTPEFEEEPVITHGFTDFGLADAIVENIVYHQYETPTPIQDQVIPHLMEGKDVVGIANTGTGKTAAFLLPFIHKVHLDPQQGVLILAPTRELALQIDEEFGKFARGTKLSRSLCIGGASLGRQIAELRNNPHFVIGTPGRLKDLVQRRAFDTSMFTNVVLDEVDRMLDIGFIRDIRFLIDCLPKERHSAFFSATMNRETEGIMRAFSPNPVQIKVKKHETSAQIDQDVIRIQPGENKIEVLHNLLQQEEFERVIVFGRTKHGINKLEQVLSKRGLRVLAIHGNKTQSARQRALDDFKRGRAQALLATDVAARGIDIVGVSHVINFDEPQSYEDYIHRIGRTGRAGARGKALTFIG